jgi:hypothetical protein
MCSSLILYMSCLSLSVSHIYTYTHLVNFRCNWCAMVGIRNPRSSCIEVTQWITWKINTFSKEPVLSWSLPDNVSVRNSGSNYWCTKYGMSKKRYEHSVEAPAVGHCRLHEQRKTCRAKRSLMSQVILTAIYCQVACYLTFMNPYIVI